jgi:hypothetical protein
MKRKTRKERKIEPRPAHYTAAGSWGVRHPYRPTRSVTCGRTIDLMRASQIQWPNLKRTRRPRLAEVVFLGLECIIPGQPNTPENSPRTIWQARLGRVKRQ